jgi:hypothetical protein
MNAVQGRYCPDLSYHDHRRKEGDKEKVQLSKVHRLFGGRAVQPFGAVLPFRAVPFSACVVSDTSEGWSTAMGVQWTHRRPSCAESLASDLMFRQSVSQQEHIKAPPLTKRWAEGRLQ